MSVLRPQLRIIQGVSGKLFTLEELAFFMQNLFENEDGLLEPYPIPQPFLPDYRGVPVGIDNFYAPTHFQNSVRTLAMFHGILPNNRDCLLVAATDGVYEYVGAYNLWKRINAVSAGDLNDPYVPQFVLTPTGVVIIYSSGVAYFYDGYIYDRLGFSEIPAPPNPQGPTSKRAADSLYPDSGGPVNPHDPPVEQNYSTSDGTSMVNDGGYALDGLYNFDSGLPSNYGVGRLGTVVTPEGIYSGQGKLLASEYRYKVQFIDVFGNLSPVSAPSMPVTFTQQYSWLGTLKSHMGTYVRDVGVPANADYVKKQVLCSGIPLGDRKTIGRILYRSRDLRNTGDLNYYELPGNAAGGTASFATVPDNVCDTFPDNVPDSWLVAEAPSLVPVPRFHYAAVAFGRLWIANTAREPGLVRASLIGTWGSFPDNFSFVPDPNGGEITGIVNAPDGLLVFTRTSTFKIVQDEVATNFVMSTVSNSIGCSSQDSIQTLADQTLVWVGDTGFYAYRPDTGVVKISGDLDFYWGRVLRAGLYNARSVYDSKRDEYICFVPYMDSNNPKFGFVLSKGKWRFYDPVSSLQKGFVSVNRGVAAVNAICETKDPRRLILASLSVYENVPLPAKTTHDVYVLNRFRGLPLPTRITTSWINTAKLGERGLQTVYLLIRETYYTEEQPPMKTISTINAPIRLFLYRDYSEKNPEEGYAAALNYDEMNNFWGVTEFPITLQRGQLFWAKVDVNLPETQAFKVDVQMPQFFEFMGMAFNEIPTDPSLSTLAQIRPNKV